MLLLFVITQAAQSAASYINLSQLAGELWPPLNATNSADAVFWTDTDIYNFFDEGAKTLARKCGVFTEYDESLTAVQSQGSYTLPSKHISTIQVDVNRTTVLRPRSVQNLEALDDDWQNTEDAPTSFAQNSAGVITILLYPRPDAVTDGKTIGIVEHVYPADIDANNGILAAPTCIAEYFRFYALGEARAKETKAQMMETAQWFKGLSGMMETVMSNYWGASR